MNKVDYKTDFLVRFQHCDPAGMVFYPRYYELLNAAVENFFDEFVMFSHHDLIRDQIGIPMRHINMEFLKPSCLGDVICYRFEIDKLGTSSIRFKLEIISTTNELRATGEFTLVFVNLQTKKPIKIPGRVYAEITSKLSNY
jgi:4-hydroxybenzoyl-CoA thioesterase